MPVLELATHESGLADRSPQQGRSRRGYSTHVSEPSSARLQLEAAWDRHGRSIYALACTLLGDSETAAQAVTLGMTDLARSADRGTGADVQRCMARHVFWRTQELAAQANPTLHLPPVMARLGQLAQLQRACLALCVFGGHTYREAAGLLGVPPLTVAELLTAGLRDVGRFATEAASTNPRTGP
jgi:hypothetical protein